MSADAHSSQESIVSLPFAPQFAGAALPAHNRTDCPGCDLQGLFIGALNAGPVLEVLQEALIEVKTLTLSEHVAMVFGGGVASHDGRVLGTRGLISGAHAEMLIRESEREAEDTSPGQIRLPIMASNGQLGYLILTNVNVDEASAAAIASIMRYAVRTYEQRAIAEGYASLAVDFVVTMARTVELRDQYTGAHVIRVTAYAMQLAEQAQLSYAAVERLRMGGLLHDIGKIAIPDAILCKPGSLTKEEFEVIKTHADIGDQIIADVTNLNYARPMVRWHHERMDGQGYPDGLKGEDIPVEARVLAIADSYDAMTSDRPYRKGMPHDEAMQEIKRHSGTQFDPELATVFVNNTETDLKQAAEQTDQWFHENHRNFDSTATLVASLTKPYQRKSA